MQASSDLDIEAAPQHPRSFFAEPKDVVAHPTLSREMSWRSCGNGNWMHAAYRPLRARGSVAARRACSDASKTPSPWFDSKGERAIKQERQRPVAHTRRAFA